MKTGFSASAAFLAVALWAAPASAGTFDFSALNGGTPGNLGSTSATNDGVKVTGFAFIDGGWTEQNLWVRNEPNDHGIGVCSENEDCASVADGGEGGDHNELSQLVNHEVIVLDKGTWELWTELWVSSLDGNGNEDGSLPETGRIYWADSYNLGTLSAIVSGSSFFEFEFPHFDPGVVEGLIFGGAVSAGSFDPTARYVFFVPGENFGPSNEDYLVWKASVTGENITPEPASLLLLGMGLLGAGVMRRRTR